MSYRRCRLFVLPQLSFDRRFILWTDADFLTYPWDQVNLRLASCEFYQRLRLDVIEVGEELGTGNTLDCDPTSTTPRRILVTRLCSAATPTSVPTSVPMLSSSSSLFPSAFLQFWRTPYLDVF